MRPRALPVFAVTLSLLLLLLAFLLIDPKPQKFYTPDSVGYDRLALNIVRNGVFSAQAEPPFQADLHRPPVYPVFMAAAYAVAGHEPSAVILAQALLGALTVGMTFILTRSLGLSATAGLGAAAVLAVDPVSIMAANLLLTETLYTALLVLGLVALVAYFRGRRTRWLVVSAVVLGLSGLTRPIGQYLPIMLLPLVVVAGRARARHAITAGLLFVVVGMSVTNAWAYRNYREAGVWTISDTSFVNLIYYRAREVLAAVEGTSQDAAWRSLRDRIARQASAQDLSPSQIAALEQREAVAVFAQHPKETATMTAKGTARVLADPGFSTACTLLDRDATEYECFPGSATMNESDVLGRSLKRLGEMTLLQQATLGWSSVLMAVIYLGAGAGIISLIRRRQWLVLAACLSVLGYLLVLSSGAEAYSRFRVPMVPFISILFGAGLESFLRLRGDRTSPPTAPADDLA